MFNTSTFQKNKFCLRPALSHRLQERIAQDYEPRMRNEWSGKFILHGREAGPNAVRLDGNDYLGLTGHPDIVRAQTQALKNDGEFAIQSSVFLHGTHPVRLLEQELAHWMGQEDGVICQSGYAANLGLIQAIADEETPVYVDSLAHMSLWEGVRAAKAKGIAFRHNDPAHLERMMARHGAGLVIVDSVYSTTGALCPLEQIVQITERYESMILVDESHSLGTHGPQGAGLCKQLGLEQRVHFITASLAKAFAGRAGYFTTPANLRHYVMTESFPGIFSSCLLPHEIAGLHATMKVIQKSDSARNRLHSISHALRLALDELGYPVHQGTEQIISLEAGTEPATMFLRDCLEEHEIFGAIFCAPATSKNRAMVRLTLSSALTLAEFEHTVNVARKIAPLVQPWNWPIALRHAARHPKSAAPSLRPPPPSMEQNLVRENELCTA